MQNLIVTTTNGTKTISKNYSFINPAAADSDCVAAITALNSLSDNSLVGIDRVARSSLDLPAATKQSPNLTLNPTSATSDISGDASLTFSRSGNGTVTTSVSGGITSATVNGNTINYEHGDSGGSITVTCAETDDYTSDTAVFTYTYTGTTGADVA